MYDQCLLFILDCGFSYITSAETKKSAMKKAQALPPGTEYQIVRAFDAHVYVHASVI